MSETTAVPIAPVKRSWLVWLVGGIAVAALFGIVLAWSGTAKTVAMAGTADQFLAWHKGQPKVVTTASGLQYQVIKQGEGDSPTDADVTLVNYRGSLRDGSVFDEAQQHPLPVAGMIPGFTEGLKLMNRKSTYRFWISPSLGYGAQGAGPKVPPNSLLIFDVDLIDFRNEAELRAQMQAMQAQGQMPGGPPPR